MLQLVVLRVLRVRRIRNVNQALVLTVFAATVRVPAFVKRVRPRKREAVPTARAGRSP